MIPAWATSLLNNPLIAARVKAGIAAASIGAGGWVLSHMLDWLEAHATFLSHASDLELAGVVATCAAGLIASLVGILYPQKDVSNVDAKIKTAAVTGNPACANNPAVVREVKSADGDATAIAALQTKLSEGRI